MFTEIKFYNSHCTKKEESVQHRMIWGLVPILTLNTIWIPIWLIIHNNNAA